VTATCALHVELCFNDQLLSFVYRIAFTRPLCYNGASIWK